MGSCYRAVSLTTEQFKLTKQDERKCLRDAIVPINTVATMPGVTVRARATDHWRLACVVAGCNFVRRRRLLKTEKLKQNCGYRGRTHKFLRQLKHWPIFASGTFRR